MKINNLIKLFGVAFFLFASIISCKKDDEINPNDKNSLSLNFQNKVGENTVVLNTGSYKNSSNEDFTITTLNYFISNISLKKKDGSLVSFPDQYFLIKQSEPSSYGPKLDNIPAADYTEVSFNIGVDSLKSISDVSQRKGVLDVASYGDDSMYWAWNSGYIFFKMNGISSVVPTRANGTKSFELHVGGYGGMASTSKTVNNNRKVTLTLPEAATIRKNIAPEIHLNVDISKVFNGVTQIKLVHTNMIHSPAAAVPIANNYANMFSVEHVHNEMQ